MACCVRPILQAGRINKLVIVAIARRLVTIANAVLKTGVPDEENPFVAFLVRFMLWLVFYDAESETRAVPLNSESRGDTEEVL